MESSFYKHVQAVKNEEATNNGLRQQLHLSPLEPSSGIKVLCISNNLLTAVSGIALKPNGKLPGNFVWLDMGLPNLEKESTQWSRTVEQHLFRHSQERLCWLMANFDNK